MIIGKKRARSKLKKFHLYYGGAIGAVLLFAFTILAILFMSGGEVVLLQPAANEVSDCGELNVSGEYHLVNNITQDDSVSNCFNIVADGVHLDGRGFMIAKDPNSLSPAGIYINSSNVTIENLIITGAYISGISVNGSESSLSNIKLKNNLVTQVFSWGININNVSIIFLKLINFF